MRINPVDWPQRLHDKNDDRPIYGQTNRGAWQSVMCVLYEPTHAPRVRMHMGALIHARSRHNDQIYNLISGIREGIE